MGTLPIFNTMHYEAFVGVTSPLETTAPRPNRSSPFALLVRRFSVTRRSNRGRIIARNRARVLAG